MERDVWAHHKKGRNQRPAQFAQKSAPESNPSPCVGVHYFGKVPGPLQFGRHTQSNDFMPSLISI